MKKIYLSILGIMAMTFMSQAQITLREETNAYKDGDTHEFLITTAGDEGRSGENVIWDFSSLKPTGKTLISSMTKPSDSYGDANFPEANMILEEYGNMFFFRIDNDGMEHIGGISCEMVTKYSKPIEKLKFPFKYGDRIGGEYSGDVKTKTSNTEVLGTNEVEADAYGTLFLPNNITVENVIRVKQVRTFSNTENKEISFRWYAKGTRYPILTIIKYETPTQTYTSQTALYAHTSNSRSGKVVEKLEDLNSSSDAVVYPNPFDKELTINYSLNKSGNVLIEGYDVTGKLFKTLLSVSNKEKGVYSLVVKTEDNDFQSGTYYIKIITADEIITRKVVHLE